MNKHRHSLIAAAVALALAGCDTWESRLPVAPASRSTLREAQPLELAPTTLPTTQLTTTRPLPATLPTQVRMGLDEARSRALRYNLDLAAALIDPTIASQSVAAEQAKFDAVFTARADYSTTDQPTSSRLDGSSTKNMSVTPGIELPLITGGTISVNAPISKFETDNSFSELNPAYTSDLAMSIRQPLLRGFGTDVTERSIYIAFYQQEQAELTTKLQAIRVIADVDRAFWRLQAARRELDVRLAGLDLANAQLERARRQVRANQLAEVEIVRAESGAADALELVIDAENSVKQRQREFKRLINDPELPIERDTIILPDSVPTTLSFDIDADDMIQRAMRQRTELLNAELNAIERTIDVKAAANDLLPIVTLDYTYNINGLGPSLDDSISLTRESRFVDHRVSLQVEIPIGNRVARARYRSALLQRMRTLADRKTLELQVKQEVLNAIDTIRTNYQRVAAARQRVTLNRRLADAEVRQFNNGQRTSTEVLDAQTKLADAASSLVGAEAEYQIAQVDLAFATGTTLGQAKIEFTPTAVPRVDPGSQAH
jgi:outer membrane protein TolC